MKTIDLHSHSTASDGSYSPGELVRMAKKQGLSALAITDHDTISGLSEAISEAQKLNDFELIPGVEISADYGGEIHILGYFLNPEDQNFKNRLKELKSIRENRNQRMVERFTRIGIDISLKEVEEEAKGESVGRPHFASLLIKKGISDSYQNAFDKFIGDKGKCFVPKNQYSVKEAIAIIRDNGGLAVLAHPVRLRKAETRTKMKAILEEFKDYGLTGVEVFHPDHSPDKTQQYLELAQRLDLCVTGGSDFHGAMKPFINLGVGRGNLSIPYSFLEKLKARHTELSALAG